MPVDDGVRDLLQRERPLRDQDHVRAAGEAGEDGDPAGEPAHDLDDHHAVVRFGGRVEAVNRLGGDVDGRVESEGGLRAFDVVVNRRGDADHAEAVFLVEPVRDGERVHAADDDHAVEVESLDVGHDLLRAFGREERIGARGAQDRPAARQNAADRLDIERHRQAVHQSAPAAHDADAFEVMDGDARAHDGAQDGIQAGAVAAAGQDADSFHHRTKSLSDAPTSADSGRKSSKDTATLAQTLPGSQTTGGRFVWPQFRGRVGGRHPLALWRRILPGPSREPPATAAPLLLIADCERRPQGLDRGRRGA